MNNDLRDEAGMEFFINGFDEGNSPVFIDGWREARRRAEAMMGPMATELRILRAFVKDTEERERKVFETIASKEAAWLKSIDDLVWAFKELEKSPCRKCGATGEDK